MEAISLFSGCGGDTLGLERAGFKVTGFNEFKSFAVNSHLANFPESVLIKDGNNTDILYQMTWLKSAPHEKDLKPIAVTLESIVGKPPLAVS